MLDKVVKKRGWDLPMKRIVQELSSLALGIHQHD